MNVKTAININVNISVFNFAPSPLAGSGGFYNLNLIARNRRPEDERGVLSEKMFFGKSSRGAFRRRD